MNRVTPELVVEAFKATGLKPAQGDFFPQEGCACALGAVAQYKDGNDSLSFIDELDEDYIQDFAGGFDSVTRLCEDEYNEAYQDGKKAYYALIEAGFEVIPDSDVDAV